MPQSPVIPSIARDLKAVHSFTASRGIGKPRFTLTPAALSPPAFSGRHPGISGCEPFARSGTAGHHRCPKALSSRASRGISRLCILSQRAVVLVSHDSPSHRQPDLLPLSPDGIRRVGQDRPLRHDSPSHRQPYLLPPFPDGIRRVGQDRPLRHCSPSRRQPYLLPLFPDGIQQLLILHLLGCLCLVLLQSIQGVHHLAPGG